MQYLEDWRDRTTQRRVAAIAIPMTLSNLSVPLVALAGSCIAGHLPEAHSLGAVAIGSALYMSPVWAMGFLRMSTSGLTAQAYGCGDAQALRAVLQRALPLAGVLALAILMVALPDSTALVQWMHPGPELAQQAECFLQWRWWGLPAALGNLVLNGWLIGQGRGGSSLVLLWTSQGVNILLSAGLALGLQQGVAGIAKAAIISEYAAAGLGLWMALRQSPRPWSCPPWSLTGWLPILSLSRDIFIRSLALQSVFFSLTWIGAHLGDRVVAANALLLNGLELVAFVLDGLANAVEALAGQAIGAGNGLQLRRILVVCTGWTLLGALLFSLGFAIAGRDFIDVQTGLAQVRTIAYASLQWLILLPLIAAGSYLLDGLFIGATRASALRDTMLLAGAGYALLVWLTRPLGNQGLWLAFSGFMLLRGVLLLISAYRIHRRRGWIPVPASARL